MNETSEQMREAMLMSAGEGMDLRVPPVQAGQRKHPSLKLFRSRHHTPSRG